MSVIGLIGTRGGSGRPGGSIAGVVQSGAYNVPGVLAYGNGLYVAITNNDSSIQVSEDAISWRRTGTVSSAYFQNRADRLVFLNGLFILWSSVNGSDPVMTSADGVSWTTKALDMMLDDLIWDGVRYVGAGAFSTTYGSTYAGVWTSPDLVTWTRQSTLASVSIACVGGVYVAGNNLFYRSTDLVTWTQTLTGTTLGSSCVVDAANGKFIVHATSGNIVQSSADGIAWTSGSAFSSSVKRVLWTGSEYLFIGENGIQKTTSLTSATGPTGTNDHRTSGKNGLFAPIAGRFSTVYVGGVAVQALSGGDFARSTDSGATFSYFYGELGYSYFCGASGIPEVAASPDFNVLPICGKAAGTSLFVGLGGAILDRTNSAAGVKRTSGTTANLRATAYSGSKYVAVGDGGIVLASTDRITWSVAATLGGNLLSVIWDATAAMFIAVGAGGAIYTSTAAGTPWTARTSGTARKLRCIRATTHATMKFVAVGDYSTLCYSANGTAWSAITISYETGAASRTLTSIAYGFFSSYGAGLFMVGCSSDTSVYRTESVTLPWVAKEVAINVFDIEFSAPGTFHLYGTGRTALTAT